jgi:tyrosyl-DNA phosphodiesterase 2
MRSAALLWCVLLANCGGCHETRAPAPPARTRNAVTAPRQLELLTYNVLATPQHVAQRTPPLLRLLGESGAHVIALQEVAPWFLRRLRAQPWSRRYHFAPAPGRAPGGQLVLSKLPVLRTIVRRQPGPQRRVLIVAVLDLGAGRELAVATTHMESMLRDGPIRARQLDQIFTVLRPYRQAVLLGDLNFGDGEQPETGHLDGRYRDLWTTLRAEDPGYTWNREKSPMADKGSFVGEKSRRLDRILVRGRGLRPLRVSIIGDAPVSERTPTIFPSDHFGLRGAVALPSPNGTSRAKSSPERRR